MQNVLDTFAAEVLRKRKAIGYTQRQLADKLHMSIRTIQDLEHGISNPKAETILLIAHKFFLHRSLDFFLCTGYDGHRTQKGRIFMQLCIRLRSGQMNR